MTEQRFQSLDEAPLRRRHEGRLVAGVASGLAAYLQLDVALVRVALVVLTFVGGVSVPLYAAAWLLVPDEGAPCSIAASMLGRWER